MVYATPRTSVRKWLRSSGQLILDRSFTHLFRVALLTGRGAESFVALRVRHPRFAELPAVVGESLIRSCTPQRALRCSRHGVLRLRCSTS